jgi:hypothetical protein
MIRIVQVRHVAEEYPQVQYHAHGQEGKHYREKPGPWYVHCLPLGAAEIAELGLPEMLSFSPLALRTVLDLGHMLQPRN